jgi:HAMP domain-containing protein
LKSGFWRGDWLLGLAVVDVAVQSTVRAPSDRIAIIRQKLVAATPAGNIDARVARSIAAAATTKVDIAL